MSLDVWLELDGYGTICKNGMIPIRENGRTVEITRDEWDARYPGREPVICSVDDNTVFSANITHNLGRMANEAGIYKHLWRPEEVNTTLAKDLIEPLREGLKVLQGDRERFEKFNPENGWGDYDGLVNFVSGYLRACEEFPDAKIRVWR